MAKVRIVVLLEQEMLEELEDLAGCMSDVSRGALIRELLAEALAVHAGLKSGSPPPEPSSPAELPVSPLADQPEIPVSEPEATPPIVLLG